MPATNGSVVVVCAANICRSPYAAFLLQAAMPGLLVTHAGVSAQVGRGICPSVAERLEGLGGGPEFVAEHSSRRLGAADVAQASLILTSSEAERSAVAVLDPSARPRTFTFVEAAHLLRACVSSIEQDADMTAVVRLIHGQRGRAVLPEARLASWPWRRAAHGVDVPDAHGPEHIRHATVWRAIDDAIPSIARSLEARGAQQSSYIER